MPTDRPIEICPSVLAADIARVGEQVRDATAAGAKRFQVDVMDGVFVPNITFGPLMIDAVRRNTEGIVEAHLMIVSPEKYIEDFAKAGADLIIVHQEAVPHLHRCVQQIRDTGKMAGVALNPSTPLVMLDEILEYIDLALIMTVNPGFGGQNFINSMLPKIARLREVIVRRGLNCDIEVDGGVYPSTAPGVVQAGANILVSGSSVFNKKQSVEDAMNALRQSYEGLQGG